MTSWERVRTSPEARGALVAAGIVVFMVLLAFLIRDLVLTATTCAPTTGGTDVLRLRACFESIRQAKARLPWEVAGLFIIGAILGAGIVAWRRQQ